MMNKETALVWKLVCHDDQSIKTWQSKAAAVNNDQDALSAQIREWISKMAHRVTTEADDIEPQLVLDSAMMVDWDLISRSIIYSLQPPTPKEEIN
ncbi:hypothetical protein [Persicobacter psychrovividus]|uniref:Uncharacterized protein n=1 Tax=Persicobacter psychrovividus TaxID=387638 RepID=A0ABN6L7Y6_9BACT|nr:hypothetical protein PEPS_15930 [Persicobacter psychrovividus]